ncbi:hypothetical protein KGQ90_03490 [Modicisalibacter tunisiensis]|uniref:hypothetical protein n=1 Tax=Modicisalibacter tunisiensis TaxID=390637 RepID=UPI001CCFF372|nr:hypothetical protein [Modicisalibacter tunisiensis]MBZ9538006.1 hypothetical protein [Modicisalibacter tunisiensis]
MPALIFFISLLALSGILAVSLVRFTRRRIAARSTPATGSRKRRRSGTSSKASGARRRRSSSGGDNRSAGKAAAASRTRRGWRLPAMPSLRVPFPRGMAACLPLGLLLGLIAGAGQLSLYGLRQAQGALNDPRLVSLDNALAAISLGALLLIVLGLLGRFSARRAT